MTLVHILLGVILAILRAMVDALVALFTSFFWVGLGLVGVAVVVMFFSSALGFGVFRHRQRRKDS